MNSEVRVNEAESFIEASEIRTVLQRTSLWLPLRSIRGNPLPSINLHHLSLITRPTCSSLPGLFNQPARVVSLRSLVLPR